MNDTIRSVPTQKLDVFFDKGAGAMKCSKRSFAVVSVLFALLLH